MYKNFIFVPKLTSVGTYLFIVIVVFFVSFILSLIGIPQIIRVFINKDLYDAPGGRKLHKNLTPSMGGAAIFFSFFVVSLLFIDLMAFHELKFLFASVFILFFMGLRDDMVPLKSTYKMVVQLLAASLLVGLSSVKVTSLYSLNSFFLIENLPEWLSFFMSVIIIVGVTNAYNLIDGIDGLAATLAIIVLGFLSVWFGFNLYWNYCFLCVSMLGAIVGFLYYNWSPAKIFMGDTGSLIIGFFCISMIFLFLNENHILEENNITKIHKSVAFFLTIFLYPFFDFTRIFVVRLLNKKSPFLPDKRHIHLLLKRLGLSHKQIVLMIVFFEIGAISLFFVLYVFNVNELLMILAIVLYCSFFHYYLGHRVKVFMKDKKLFDPKKLYKRYH